MPVRSRSPALKLLAAPAGVAAMPDINDEDFVLLLVDLVQRAPISHEACAPGAIQRRVQRLPQPSRVADQRPGYEVDGGSRNVWRKLARNSPPRWRRKSYLIDVRWLSHVARRGGHARRPLPGRRRPGPRLRAPRSGRAPRRNQRESRRLFRSHAAIMPTRYTPTSRTRLICRDGLRDWGMPLRRRRTTETVLKQILRPGCHVIRPALPGSEPGRRPGPVLDGPKVPADIIEHRRDFLLGKPRAA